MVKIKRLTEIPDIIKYTKLFNKSIGYSNVPWKYFASGVVYALFDEKNRIIGGFVLVPGYFNTRSILQMPEDTIKNIYNEKRKLCTGMCDLTGYFILNPKKAFLFTLFLALYCLFYSKKYFVYTYPIHDVALEKYYSNGNPVRIHTGIPQHLEGHGDNMEIEHIEVLTKWGIIKIFLYRTSRLIQSWFE